MVNEDRKVVAAVHRERERIANGVQMIAESLRKGGRLIFVGAGTSGRLGVVEAAEMPPTFGVSPTRVRAIMAGGKDAVFVPKEGVEDDYEEGARAIARMRPQKRDVVIGISASGVTPFVRGALTRARKAGLRIIFVTCWPGNELQNFVDLLIAPDVGPEVLTGSTRLKAGTATKMVLNMLTTIAMVRIGKTYGNLMVDVQTTNEKLKDRGRRIIAMATGLDYEAAGKLLKTARNDVKAAIVMHKTGLPLSEGPGAPAQVARLDSRSRRRRRLAAPARAARTAAAGVTRRTHRPAQRRPAAASGSQKIISTRRCSCRNDAGTLVVTGPVTAAMIASRLARARRQQQHARAPSESCPCPSTAPRAGTLATSPPKNTALPSRDGRSRVTRCVRAVSPRPAR